MVVISLLWALAAEAGAALPAAFQASQAASQAAVRRAGEDLARLLMENPPLEAALALLQEAGASYDADITVPTRFVRECRSGRALGTVLGMYRAGQAYALGFGQSTKIPLRETLEQTALSPSVRHGLTQGWALVQPNQELAPRAREDLRQTLLSLPTVEDMRTVVDTIYGSLLEQAHIVCASLLRVPPEKWERGHFAPVLQALIQRTDGFRRTLQGWAASPVLLKELGLHSDITLLDRMQVALEVLLMQPTVVVAQGALALLAEEREDLVRLCKLPPKEEKGEYWQLQTRDDLFKPRNFF